jgi:ribosomal protein S18 acetylase RimI-like enzyme
MIESNRYACSASQQPCKTVRMRQTSQPSPKYWKETFEWTASNSKELRAEPVPESVSWRDADLDEDLVLIVGRVLETSSDVSDSTALAKFGSVGAAQRLLDAPPAWKCSHSVGWWRILEFNGQSAGFVLPVTFDELGGKLGTIFHMGVVPEYRGLGLSRLLLRHTVRTLFANGAERIFCDTGATNEPMIRSFTSEGWTSLGPREVPIPVDFLQTDFAT